MDNEDREEHEKFTNTKSVVVGAIVLVVIIASFWLSFSLGKKVFVPVRPEDKEDRMALELAKEIPLETTTPGTSTSATPAEKQAKPEVEMPKVEVKVTPLAQTPKIATVTKITPPVTPKEPVKKTARAYSKPAAARVQPTTEKKVVHQEAAKTPRKWVFYYKVLAGSFAKEVNAQQLSAQLKAKGFPVFIDKVTVGGQKFFRVQTGAFTRKSEADAMLSNLNTAGFAGSILIE